MGYLTPLLIRNDSIEDIRNHPQETIEQIIRAIQQPEPYTLQIGSFYNPIESLGSRHADISRTVVIGGNHWQELSNPLLSVEDIQNMQEHQLDYLKKNVKLAETHIEKLKKKIKEAEDK